jgi:drug/metabolite transporter (DMT)-like permease
MTSTNRPIDVRVRNRLDARGIALAILVMVLVGGSFAMVKVGLRDLPVFGLLLLRMLVASVALGIYMRWVGLPFAYSGRARQFVVAQTVAFAAGQVLLFLGLAQTTAGRGAILLNVQPFITLLLLPLFVPTERLDSRRVLGTAIAFAGVVFVLAERGVSGGAWVGDLLVLASAVLWTSNVIMNKTMPAELHPVPLIFWGVSGAVPVLVAMTLIFEPHATWRLTTEAVVSVMYLGIVTAAFSFVAFVWLIRAYSASRVNAFVFLSPVFGVLVGWIALGEQLTWTQAAGTLGVAAGIWIVNTDK